MKGQGEREGGREGRRGREKIKEREGERREGRGKGMERGGLRGGGGEIGKYGEREGGGELRERWGKREGEGGSRTESMDTCWLSFCFRLAMCWWCTILVWAGRLIFLSLLALSQRSVASSPMALWWLGSMGFPASSAFLMLPSKSQMVLFCVCVCVCVY